MNFSNLIVLFICFPLSFDDCVYHKEICNNDLLIWIASYDILGQDEQANFKPDFKPNDPGGF